MRSGDTSEAQGGFALSFFARVSLSYGSLWLSVVLCFQPVRRSSIVLEASPMIVLGGTVVRILVV